MLLPFRVIHGKGGFYLFSQLIACWFNSPVLLLLSDELLSSPTVSETNQKTEGPKHDHDEVEHKRDDFNSSHG
jgi:hypothetical protein